MSDADARDESFVHPLAGRYGGRAMRRLFSPAHRARVWRRCWLALAEAQSELGLPIPADVLDALRARADDVDLDRVAAIEAETGHNEVAHLRAFCEGVPGAGAALHLGATSYFVTDHGDLLIVRQALGLVRERLMALLAALRGLARRHRDLPALGRTHLQPAQPVTLGKRACLWAQDLLMDLGELDRLRLSLPARGAKGATGTQASYLILFGGDHDRVRKLDHLVAEKLGFRTVLPVTSQTYSRKIDGAVLHALAQVAVSLGKLAGDLRLLAAFGEVAEPFGERQVGSSAMPHKRNPVLCERISALARYVAGRLPDALNTASSQWLERSLDDSAIRRMILPEAFLACEAALGLAVGVVEGLYVDEAQTRRSLDEAAPLLAAEVLLMRAVNLGMDRLAVHERLRDLAVAAGVDGDADGRGRRFLQAVAEDAGLAPLLAQGDPADPAVLVGRAPQQVDEFLAEHLDPVLDGEAPEAAS